MMTDQVILNLERKQIEVLARRRGFERVEDYLLALIERDQQEQDAVSTEISPADSFRAGWHDLLAGNVHPIETLWDQMDEDTD